nr:tetratricopeptide repeat protein [Pseudopontixanthobacter vadosimaris]
MLPSQGVAQTGSDLIPALEQLAAKNNAEAIYHLGMAYHTGAGLPRNPAKALEMFRQAAAQGDVLASYKLGCFYDGQGGTLVQQDAETALRHKLVAAEAGYALAQQDVAALYAAQRDWASAVQWLEKAMLQGWPDALSAYASVHNSAEGVKPNPVKTAAYFRIFLDRTEGSERQREWLSTFEEQMTAEQRQEVDEIVRSYRPAPTALTIKALSGQRAATELVS